MADTNVRRHPFALAERVEARKLQEAEQHPRHDLIELLFFAYRDFIGDPDDILADFGFGRAHHRILYFVERNPGIRISDLLDLLRITKQSLGRVLKELVDADYIEQRTGSNDRRQRLLYTTPKGQHLITDLSLIQTRRISHALAELPDDSAEIIREFLLKMITPDSRPDVINRLAEEEALASEGSEMGEEDQKVRSSGGL